MDDIFSNRADPLPGGYTAGEMVFYTAASQTTSTGDKVVRGQQGVVTGPATLFATHRGNGVQVLFPGNKSIVECYLYQVRRLCRAPAANPTPAPCALDAAHAPCVPATALTA